MHNPSSSLDGGTYRADGRVIQIGTHIFVALPLFELQSAARLCFRHYSSVGVSALASQPVPCVAEGVPFGRIQVHAPETQASADSLRASEAIEPKPLQMDRNDRVLLRQLALAVALAVASVLLVWAILAVCNAQ